MASPIEPENGPLHESGKMHNVVRCATLGRGYLSELNIDVASLRRRGWNLCGYRIMQDSGLEHRGSSIQPGVRAGDPRSSHVDPRFDVLPLLTDERNAPLMIVMRRSDCAAMLKYSVCR